MRKTRVAAGYLTAALLVCAAICGAAEEEFAGLRFRKEPDGSVAAGGLGWRAGVEKDGVRLGRRAHICFEEGGYGLEGWCTYAGADWADIGLARPGAAAITPQAPLATWATAQQSFSYQEDGKAQTFRVLVTRLSPAVLLEISGKELRLFESAKAWKFAKNDANWVPAEQKLSGPAPVPRYFGAGTAVKARDDVAALDLSKGWLLAWYGAGSRIRAETEIGHRTITVDCPVLLACSAPPATLACDASGLGLTFAAEGVKRVAVLPLLGERLPKAVPGEKPKPYPAFVGAFRANHEFQFAELPPTETWKDGLPKEVLAQCEWWAERLKEFPVAVRDTYTYDPATDSLAVQGKLEFLKLAEGGKRFAPLPPMLAVAARKNLALLTVQGAPISSGLMTKWGPYVGMEGADSYAYSVKGLGKYVFETRASGAGKEPEEVRKAFDAELAKIFEAGILAPWFPIVSVGGYGARASRANNETHRLLWGIPGENLYFIGQCLELATPEQRVRLVELAKAWEAKYPSEKVAHMPGNQDAPREHYLATIHRVRQWPDRAFNLHYLNKVLPCESEYYLAEYYRYTGQKPAAVGSILEPYLARSDWASLGLLRGEKTWWKKEGRDQYDRDCGKGGVDDINRLFAGLVGRVRLARIAGNAQAVERGMYFLARAGLLRLALEEWKYVLHEDRFLGLRLADAPERSFFGTGLHTFARKTPHDDPLVVAEMDEFLLTMRECYVHVHWHPHRLIAYLDLVPELGRFLQDHLRNEVSQYIRVVEESNPEWYTPYADCTLSFETYCLHPADSYQVFLARAWVAGDAPEKLWKYADQPWVGRGDWFYIHKLAETIRAYRGVTWVADGK